MNKMARAAGILFLVSTVAYLLGSGILDPILNRPEVLANLYPERTKAIAGWFLELINALAVAGIAMFLYPVLKKHNEAFAAGYFGSRIIESALLMISAAVPLVLIALSKDYISSGGSHLVTAGSVLAEAYSVFFQMAMIALGVGSLLLCVVLYRTRWVPRWLSVIGFFGYAALLASSCLTILGKEPGTVLYAPGAIFEIVFPIWIIIKGLNVRAEDL